MGRRMAFPCRNRGMSLSFRAIMAAIMILKSSGGISPVIYLRGTDDGFGFQATFFRSARLPPSALANTNVTDFDNNSIFLAHMALLDVKTGKYFASTTIKPGGGWDAISPPRIIGRAQWGKLVLAHDGCSAPNDVAGWFGGRGGQFSTGIKTVETAGGFWNELGFAKKLRTTTAAQLLS